ncbi:hypothetical protein CBG25_07185 [Arsenophonus sp. ENCA]|uniref:hypothetical protein n=1 Tax=Arsenophonus sp. ENCA TaxID=1987579 RepID=UPI000BD040F4|nr:hypothetical protein [Arsenophonus sp. ENCA]PAV04617.1 hypothetical protein CBG25_07185 [Arsenophonus sp. ENCA]
MIDASLLDLPWATLVTLASGYIGYFIANVGLKEHHKPIDILFSTLIFSLLPTAIYHVTLWYGVNAYTATLLPVLLALTLGASWRKYGRKRLYAFLRKHNISWSDGTHAAWQQMFGLTDYRVTELFVVLKDGSGLLSRLPGRFEGLPNGPFTLGNNGDVILYVTHRSSANSDEWVEYGDVIHQDYGALATYIPADQITRIDIRRREAKPSCSSTD